MRSLLLDNRSGGVFVTMTTILAATAAIASINKVQFRFNLSRTTDLQFFSEWLETLPELTPAEEVLRVMKRIGALIVLTSND